jgi:hypothetical protein
VLCVPSGVKSSVHQKHFGGIVMNQSMDKLGNS